jgi:hypothetical protein
MAKNILQNEYYIDSHDINFNHPVWHLIPEYIQFIFKRYVKSSAFFYIRNGIN